MALSISPHDLASIRSHARAAAPEECCGILLGVQREETIAITEVLGARNAAPGDRRRQYLIAPEELLAAIDRARSSGLRVVGFYHSHPDAEAVPSREDRRWGWAGTSHLLVAGADLAVRSWRRPRRESGWAEEEIRLLCGEPAE